MSKHAIVIGKDLNEVVAANIKTVPLHLYIKGNKYFASFATPEEVAAALTDSDKYKIARVAPLSVFPSVADHESLLNMIAGSLLDAASVKEVIRITELAELNPTPERFNIGLLHQAFSSGNMEFMVLPPEAYKPGFKAMKRNAYMVSDGIVYVYTKDKHIFTSFSSDVGDVKENGISVTTWLPGWERNALNTNDIYFVDHLHYLLSSHAHQITSIPGLVSYISMSGIKQPTPIVSKEVAKVCTLMAETVIDKIKESVNTFGSGGMPITEESTSTASADNVAPRVSSMFNPAKTPHQVYGDFAAKFEKVKEESREIQEIKNFLDAIGIDSKNIGFMDYRVCLDTSIKDVCAALNAEKNKESNTSTATEQSAAPSSNEVGITCAARSDLYAGQKKLIELYSDGNKSVASLTKALKKVFAVSDLTAQPKEIQKKITEMVKPAPKIIKSSYNALKDLVDPYGDGAGIISSDDFIVKWNKGQIHPSAAYYLYKVNGCDFISDRCSVGNIYSDTNIAIGNILGDNLYIRMSGQDVANQINIGYITDIDNIEELIDYAIS